MSGFDQERLNKQAREDLGDDYRVERYKYLYLLYELGNVVFQTSDGLAMMMYIIMLADRNKKRRI